MSKYYSLARCYGLLGILEKEVLLGPQITPQLGQVWKQLHLAQASSNAPKSDIPTNPYYYLHSSDDPEALKVIQFYYSIPPTARSRLPIEAFCKAAAVSPLRILEIIVAATVRLAASASAIISAATHPRVVEKTVEYAMTFEGHADRQDLHKAVGFLPTPRGGPSIRITQTNQNQTAVTQPVAAPLPEQTIRRLSDRFNDARPALPAPVDAIPFAHPVEREAIPVPARDVEDSEDDE